MRAEVTPAAAPSAPSSAPTPTATFARRVRALRIALAIALVVAVPLVVALATHQGRSGTEDAYRQQAQVDATAVARVAGATPRAEIDRELERLRRANADVRGIAVYRRSASGSVRELASSGLIASAPASRGGARERHADGRHLLEVDVPARGGRVTRVAWDLARTDAAIADSAGGFPLGLTLAVLTAALLAYALLSRFGLRRLAGLADEL